MCLQIGYLRGARNGDNKGETFMQNKDKEINPKGKELESEKTTQKESTELSFDEIIEIHEKMRRETPWMKNKIDLYEKGILDTTMEDMFIISSEKEIEIERAIKRVAEIIDEDKKKEEEDEEYDPFY
jgi:hypothetical protein